MDKILGLVIAKWRVSNLDVCKGPYLKNEPKNWVCGTLRYAI